MGNVYDDSLELVIRDQALISNSRFQIYYSDFI
jgi:hypothetical protein